MICSQQIKQLFSLKQILAFEVMPPLIICYECRESFGKINGHVCSGCGRILNKDGLCDDCIRWQNKFGYILHNQALFEYDSTMKKFMKQYKFNGDYRLRSVFKTEMKLAIKMINFDLVVPIPITHSTASQRGFNQVEGIIEDCEYTQLLRTIETDKVEPQSHKTRQERLELQQPFELLEATKGIVSEKTVLLVDDVYTTGTTLYHAANLLKMCGTKKISSLTLAR